MCMLTDIAVEAYANDKHNLSVSEANAISGAKETFGFVKDFFAGKAKKVTSNVNQALKEKSTQVIPKKKTYRLSKLLRE